LFPSSPDWRNSRDLPDKSPVCFFLLNFSLKKWEKEMWERKNPVRDSFYASAQKTLIDSFEKYR
jgi:hypothetical protein